MNNLRKILKNKLGSKKLIVVFPHPDDETMATGGLLLWAHKYGWKTTVITLTKGENGQCYIDGVGKSLADIRYSELKDAAKVLNVDKLIVGDFNDAQIRNSAKKVETWLSKLIKSENPDVIATYDHSGFTAHPDHISLSLIVLKIVKSLKTNIDLYWLSLPKFLSQKLVDARTIKFFMSPTHRLGLGRFWFKKFLAAKKHKSQKLDGGKPLLLLYLALFQSEWYYKVDLNKKYRHKFVHFRI